MADLLGRYTPDSSSLERIAETAAQWAVDPGTKVAVRIWAVEVLKHCRERVGWVAEAWDDLVETMAHGATPGIECPDAQELEAGSERQSLKNNPGLIRTTG